MTRNGNPVCIRVENSYHAKGSKRLFNFQFRIFIVNFSLVNLASTASKLKLRLRLANEIPFASGRSFAHNIK